MTQELLYTSAPRGLKPGIKGFCTVASTAGMAPTLADRLESLSGYKHLFPPHDRQAQLNPVLFSHLILKVGGQTLHVLSRICDAGLDYSQRSNKFAHHVALSESELAPAGPAWLLSQPGFMETDFAGDPRILAAGRKVPRGDAPPRICRAWESLAGDAGWAGVLAEAALGASPKTVNVIYRPGTDVLALVHEALALVPAARRWGVTFSTYYTKLPPGLDCQWRFLVDGEAEAKTARRTPQTLLIDLWSQLGPAEGGPLVAAARTGILPEAAAPEAAPVGHFSPGPGVAAAPFLTRVEQPNAREPASRPTPAHEWPTYSPAAIQPRRARDMKRLAVGGAKVLVIALLVAAAAVLGELHGRGVLQQQNEQVAITASTDAHLPGDIDLKRGREEGATAPANVTERKPEKPADTTTGSATTKAPVAPPPHPPGPPSSDVHDAQRTLPEGMPIPSPPSDNSQANAYDKTNSAPRPAPPDFKKYKVDLKLFSMGNRGILKLPIYSLSHDDADLRVPVCPGINLRLGCARAKFWDPALENIWLERDGDSQKWFLHVTPNNTQDEAIAVLNAAGEKLTFKWLSKPESPQSLADCSLFIRTDDPEETQFFFRDHIPTIQLDLNPKTAEAVKKLVSPPERADGAERAWPEHRRVLVTARCPLPGFELLQIMQTGKQQVSLVPWPQPSFEFELQEKIPEPIYAKYKGDDELAVRFLPAVERQQNTGVFTFKVSTEILVSGKLAINTDTKSQTSTLEPAEWEQLSEPQKLDLGRAYALAKDINSKKSANLDREKGPFAKMVAELGKKRTETERAKANVDLSKATDQKSRNEITRLDSRIRELNSRIILIRDFCEQLRGKKIKEAKTLPKDAKTSLLEATITLKEPAD